MEVRIKSLKIGSRIYIGCNNGISIPWLKASKDSDLISEFVLFKASVNEQNNRESIPFEQTALYKYLNGLENFRTVRGMDIGMFNAGSVSHIFRESGSFMDFFDDYETNQIREFTLISSDELENFSLFKKFRKRAGSQFGGESMMYHLRDRQSGLWSNGYHFGMGRNGEITNIHNTSSSGVRPLCRIDPETLVVPASGGFMISEERYSTSNKLSDVDLMNFLGIPGGL